MEVKCLRLDDDARGIATINGKVTFIPNLLPSEIANIKITKEKSKYNEGEVVTLKAKSKDRITPKCPYINCGCTLSYLDYPKQLQYKENKVKNLFKRYFKNDITVNPIIYDDESFGYRDKITLKVEGKLGYYKYMTTDFFPIKKCLLVSDKVNQIINVINMEDLSDVSTVTIKEMDEVMIIIKGNMVIDNIIPLVDSIYLNDKHVYGKKYINASLCDLKFNVSKDSFFQVNKYMVSKLYNEAIRMLTKETNKTILDLYCGTGTISLLVAPYFKKVIGVEINQEAVECANMNMKLNNIDNVEFICGDANKVIKDILNVDSLIVDPPRAGLSKSGIENIINIKAKEIVYISCNPITMIRDLNCLSDIYNIEEVTPVDMFPNTHHVECVSLLCRKPLIK